MLDAIVLNTYRYTSDHMAEAEDGELINACCAGNTSAFEILYLRYHPRVYRFVFRMLDDHEMAEEVVADTLYAVWKSASAFKARSAVSSWILGIAYRTALKALERNGRFFRGREDAEVLDTIADESPHLNPELTASQFADTNLVIGALSKLSPEHQAVVQLTATGHSCAEIATIVDCPVNTVKTRMFHARKQLQRLLGSDVPDTKRE